MSEQVGSSQPDEEEATVEFSIDDMDASPGEIERFHEVAKNADYETDPPIFLMWTNMDALEEALQGYWPVLRAKGRNAVPMWLWNDDLSFSRPNVDAFRRLVLYRVYDRARAAGAVRSQIMGNTAILCSNDEMITVAASFHAVCYEDELIEMARMFPNAFPLAELFVAKSGRGDAAPTIGTQVRLPNAQDSGGIQLWADTVTLRRRFQPIGQEGGANPTSSKAANRTGSEKQAASGTAGVKHKLDEAEKGPGAGGKNSKTGEGDDVK